MIITTKAIPFMEENIDTDQIIPAAFLKTTTKVGLGKHLFSNWRYQTNGQPNNDFVLNKKEYVNANLLITGHNFGCGSSREHAAWALADYGIKAIISTGFADIFKLNAYNNHILPIELNPIDVKRFTEFVHLNHHQVFIIDVLNQSIKVEGSDFERGFELDAFKKECLINGVDETQYLVNLKKEIELFEQKQKCVV